ncbi:hypothetical protein HYU23_02915 [Candidatus Woesearchaeota archaeon]|nr:hypothetical protein [Candidatus Woesearchaeota archaeon]
MYNKNRETGFISAINYVVPTLIIAGLTYLSLGSLNKVSKAIEGKSPNIECMRSYAGYSTDIKSLERLCAKK